MRWNDLRLLPGAAAIWSLAAIGVLLGAQAATSIVCPTTRTIQRRSPNVWLECYA